LLAPLPHQLVETPAAKLWLAEVMSALKDVIVDPAVHVCKWSSRNANAEQSKRKSPAQKSILAI